MHQERVVCFVDGFNLYHAIQRLNCPHLKWVNLWDLAPAIHMIIANFPDKHVTTIVPPHYQHSNELIKASSDKAKITIDHLQRCLLPATIYDAGGNTVATRPLEYMPPAMT